MSCCGTSKSAAEFRSALLADTAHRLEIVPINPQKFAFKPASKAVEYYRRGAPRFYMIWGNDVLSYDQSAAAKLFSRFSRSAEQLAGIAIGAQPKLLIPRDFADERALTELQRLRLLMGVFALSVVGGCAALLMLRTGRR